MIGTITVVAVKDGYRVTRTAPDGTIDEAVRPWGAPLPGHPKISLYEAPALGMTTVEPDPTDPEFFIATRRYIDGVISTIRWQRWGAAMPGMPGAVIRYVHLRNGEPLTQENSKC